MINYTHAHSPYTNLPHTHTPRTFAYGMQILWPFLIITTVISKLTKPLNCRNHDICVCLFIYEVDGILLFTSLCKKNSYYCKLIGDNLVMVNLHDNTQL